MAFATVDFGVVLNNQQSRLIDSVHYFYSFDFLVIRNGRGHARGSRSVRWVNRLRRRPDISLHLKVCVLYRITLSSFAWLRDVEFE